MMETTENDTHRTLALLAQINAGKRWTRKALAARYGITTRAVSMMLVRARTRYGVRLIHAKDGYAIDNPGVFDLNRVAQFTKGKR